MLHAKTSEKPMADRRGAAPMEYAMIVAAAGPLIATGFSAYASRFETFFNILVASLP